MNEFLVKGNIGEFFAKMYEANKEKDLEVTLKMVDGKIEVYNRDAMTFKYIRLIDEAPSIDSLVESVSE